MELKSKGQGMPELRQIARKCIDLALEGEPWALKEIWNRLDGKAPQFSTDNADHFRRAVDMTDDELAAIAAGALSAIAEDDTPGTFTE